MGERSGIVHTQYVLLDGAPRQNKLLRDRIQGACGASKWIFMRLGAPPAQGGLFQK